MFTDAWARKEVRSGARATSLKQDIAKYEKQSQQLLERVIEATNTSVIAAYERKIADLELKKKVAAEKLERTGASVQSFETMFEHAFRFLANPCKLWETGHVHVKRMVLRLAFSERIAYKKDEGFRTPHLSLPFKLLGDMSMAEKEMVPRRGIEPLFPA